MRNCDYYKTPEELIVARCKKYTCSSEMCSGCELDSAGVTCSLRFAYMEHEEPKPLKRRPYTMEEAKELLGKTLHSEWGGHIEIVMDIRLNEKDEVLINGMHQNDLMENSSTVDGKPFGVEVKE